MVIFHNRTYTDYNQKWSICTIFCFLTSLYFWIFVFNAGQWMTFHNTVQRKLKRLTDENDNEILNLMDQFRQTWKEVMETKLIPKRVLGGCDMVWRRSSAKPWWQKLDRTCERNSYISRWDIKPAGEFSRFILQSMYINNTRKTRGGDFWRVKIAGNSSAAVSKIDFGNGTYEFKFLTMVSGHYEVEIALEYTLCDGIKEPPPYWFIKGNRHGKEQQQGILGNDYPYINKILWQGAGITIYIPPNRLTHEEKTILSNSICNIPKEKCRYLWNDYGSWFNTTWQPFCPEVTARYPRKHQGILWIFGDSVGTQFYHRIKFGRLCKKIFKTCMYSYNWVYALQNYNIATNAYTIRNSTLEKNIWDGLDFNTTKLIDELEQALFHPHMDKHSVILFNYGLHFTEATNFTNFQKLIKAVIQLRKKTHCKMIWRTITSLNRHKYRRPNLHSRRFLTSQRVLLYNAYATREFCKAGFEVIDIYSITDSYPYGTGSKLTPTDPVHYEFHVMKPLENTLIQIFDGEKT